MKDLDLINDKVERRGEDLLVSKMAEAFIATREAMVARAATAERAVLPRPSITVPKSQNVALTTQEIQQRRQTAQSFIQQYAPKKEISIENSPFMQPGSVPGSVSRPIERKLLFEKAPPIVKTIPKDIPFDVRKELPLENQLIEPEKLPLQVQKSMKQRQQMEGKEILTRPIYSKKTGELLNLHELPPQQRQVALQAVKEKRTMAKSTRKWVIAKDWEPKTRSIEHQADVLSARIENFGGFRRSESAVIENELQGYKHANVTKGIVQEFNPKNDSVMSPPSRVEDPSKMRTKPPITMPDIDADIRSSKSVKRVSIASSNRLDAEVVGQRSMGEAGANVMAEGERRQIATRRRQGGVLGPVPPPVVEVGGNAPSSEPAANVRENMNVVRPPGQISEDLKQRQLIGEQPMDEDAAYEKEQQRIKDEHDSLREQEIKHQELMRSVREFGDPGKEFPPDAVQDASEIAAQQRLRSQKNIVITQAASVAKFQKKQYKNLQHEENRQRLMREQRLMSEFDERAEMAVLSRRRGGLPGPVPPLAPAEVGSGAQSSESVMNARENRVEASAQLSEPVGNAGENGVGVDVQPFEPVDPSQRQRGRLMSDADLVAPDPPGPPQFGQPISRMARDIDEMGEPNQRQIIQDIDDSIERYANQHPQDQRAAIRASFESQVEEVMQKLPEDVRARAKQDRTYRALIRDANEAERAAMADANGDENENFYDVDEHDEALGDGDNADENGDEEDNFQPAEEGELANLEGNFEDVDGENVLVEGANVGGVDEGYLANLRRRAGNVVGAVKSVWSGAQRYGPGAWGGIGNLGVPETRQVFERAGLNLTEDQAEAVRNLAQHLKEKPGYRAEAAIKSLMDATGLGENAASKVWDVAINGVPTAAKNATVSMFGNAKNAVVNMAGSAAETIKNSRVGHMAGSVTEKIMDSKVGKFGKSAVGKVADAGNYVLNSLKRKQPEPVGGLRDMAEGALRGAKKYRKYGEYGMLAFMGGSALAGAIESGVDQAKNRDAGEDAAEMQARAQVQAAALANRGQGGYGGRSGPANVFVGGVGSLGPMNQGVQGDVQMTDVANAGAPNRASDKALGQHRKKPLKHPKGSRIAVQHPAKKRRT